MNIIDVVISDYDARMNEYIFEMNAALADPSREGSIERLAKATRGYACTKAQVDILKSMKGQMEAEEDYINQQNKYHNGEGLED